MEQERWNRCGICEVGQKKADRSGKGRGEERRDRERRGGKALTGHEKKEFKNMTARDAPDIRLH